MEVDTESEIIKVVKRGNRLETVHIFCNCYKLRVLNCVKNAERSPDRRTDIAPSQTCKGTNTWRTIPIAEIEETKENRWYGQIKISQ